jgi:hypothetical protein
MIGRFVYHGIRTTAAITLVLVVMSSPIRPTKPFGTHGGPKRLRFNFATHNAAADHRDVASSRSSVTQTDSSLADVRDELVAEFEEELHATFQPSCVMFGVLRSPCSEIHRELIGFDVESATRPLRC